MIKIRWDKGRSYLHKELAKVIFLLFLTVHCFSFSGCTMSFITIPMEYGAEGSDTSMLVFSQGFRFGYIDSDGKVIIKPQYADAHPFYEDLAAVKCNGKYGYIDKKGNTVIAYQYSCAYGFHNGLAVVQKLNPNNQRNNSFVIDVKGKVFQDLGYLSYIYYEDGLYRAKNEDGEQETIYDSHFNEIGKIPALLTCLGYHDGIAAASVPSFAASKQNQYDQSQYYVYINGDCKQLFQEKFLQAERFSDGLAAVIPYSEDGRGSGYGYIDKNGNMVIQEQYSETCPFGEGFACVYDNGWVIIDKSGKQKGIIKAPEHSILREPIGSFSDGLCIVRISPDNNPLSSSYGYIDTSGNWIIMPKYREATPFENGIAEVKIDGKIGYIDKTGKYIWGPK